MSGLGEGIAATLADNSNNITLFELKIQELTIVKNNLKKELLEKDRLLSEKDKFLEEKNKLFADKDLIIAELRQDKKMLMEDKERLLSEKGNRREQA